MKFTRTRFTILVCLLVVAAFVIQRQSAATKNAHRLGQQFKKVALCMSIYISASQEFPPPVIWSKSDPRIPLYSWRLPISTFMIDGGMLGPDNGSAWDTEQNSHWRKLKCEFGLNSSGDYNPDNSARILAITGPDTAFGVSGAEGSSWSPDIVPNDTIMLIEFAKSDWHWTEPGDLNIDSIEKYIRSESQKTVDGILTGRFHVVFADFQVWALSTKTPYKDLEPFFTKSGAAAQDRSQLLKKHCLAIVYDGG